MSHLELAAPCGVFLRYDEPAADAVLEREGALELVRGLEEWVAKSAE